MSKTHTLLGALLVLVVGFFLGSSVTTGKTTLPQVHISKLTKTSSHKFDSTDAEEEGYWYSRYNLGNLSMRSGMGETIKPEKEMIMKAIGAVDADFNPAKMKAGDTSYGDGDHVALPKNPAFISNVFKSGDPHYMTKFNPTDFGTQRWNKNTMDTSLTGLANGFTILKEVEWARQFHVDEHFGTPNANFGAYWRFVGMIMNMNAKRQTKSFLENMSQYDLSHGGKVVMLMALSDLSGLLSVDKLAHSDVPNRYRDPAMAKMVQKGTDKVFDMVFNDQPKTVKETSLAIQSMNWYAAK